MKGYSRWKRRRALTGYALARPGSAGHAGVFCSAVWAYVLVFPHFWPRRADLCGADNYAYVLSTRSFRLAAGNTLRFLGWACR